MCCGLDEQGECGVVLQLDTCSSFSTCVVTVMRLDACLDHVWARLNVTIGGAGGVDDSCATLGLLRGFLSQVLT